MKQNIRSLILLVTLLALVALVGPAHAAGYVVSNTADSGPGSLRQAILDAEAAPGADAITFSVSGTITLASTLPTITDPAGLTIDGAGQTVVISGNDAVGIMEVESGAALTLNQLTLSDGFGRYGGAMYNRGSLTVGNSNFTDNWATIAGGAIENGGTLVINNSSFSANFGTSWAGAINNYGPLTVNDSSFAGNSSSSGSGAIENISVVIIDNSTFVDNSNAGASGFGGAIYNPSGSMTISNSTFSGNSNNYHGGAIAVGSGMVTVSNSTFSGNSADLGGGIYNDSGTVTITGNTFSMNQAAGGGGLFSFGGSVTVSNSTFSNNAGSLGGGIFNYGTLTLKNSIVANSLSGGNCAGPAAISDGGGNLSYPDTTCPGANLDPQLGPLQDNGGPTETMALLPGSPAIDAAVDCPPPATDQRGVARPQGSACDIGAFELEQNAPPAVTVDSDTVSVDEGQTAVNTGTISDPEGDTVTLSASAGSVVNNNDGTWAWRFGAADGPSQSQTVTITADDGNGGSSSATFDLVVNNVAPAISSVTNDGPIIANESATIVVDASDPAGTADPLTYVFDCDNDGSYEIGPQAADSASCLFTAAGDMSVNVQVADDDGGVTAGSTTVTVLTAQEAIANLQADVQALVGAGSLNQGQGNALNSKLDNAIKKLDQGKPQVAINNLNAFINQVNAFINSGVLTAAEGQPLIDAANRIIAAIEAGS